MLRTVIALLAMTATARAESVADAGLQAVTDRLVQLELDGAATIEGRVLGFDAASVTVALTSTNEVVTLPRPRLLRMVLVDPAPDERMRVWSVQFSALGTLMVDADYRWFHAFVSTSLTLPVLTVLKRCIGSWS